MRLLRVISSMNPINGGPSQGIRNSIPELKKLGIDNEVVCFDHPDSEFLNLDTFLIHAIGPAIGPYKYCPKIISWLLENFGRFDVVIIHGLWLYNSLATFMAWSRFKKSNLNFPKLYIMPHGMLDPYFQNAPDRKLKSLRNSIIWHLFESKIVNGVDGVLFTCEQELVLARKSFNAYRPKKEINIKYGILTPPTETDEINSLFRKSVNISNDKPFWLFLSRIHPKKGVDILIRAYLALKDLGYSLPYLIIAGPGLEDRYGKDMQSLAERDADIIFPGMLMGDQKWGALYEAELFILPSHQENFGISIVEALGCSTPVIISNQVNIWAEIEKGHGGIVCQDEDESTLQALKKWMDLSSDEKQKFKDGAFETYSEYFTIEKAAVEMAKALKNN